MTARPLAVVALDHFFDQDLRALESSPRVEVRRVPFTRLRDPAIALLGEDVGTGLERFHAPELGPRRARYAAWLAEEVERLAVEWPFDVLVLPSDVFFYVRALPDAAHRLGIPVVVVQKETTISPATMELHAAEVADHAGFVSDAMTVCSQRHQDFWVATGAPSEAIVVTGQPRFDVYARAREVTHRPSVPPTVLFLSYELDAYEPGAGQGRGGRTWAELRDSTERVLLDLAEAGRIRVVVKHHPQQDVRGETERLRAAAADVPAGAFRVADPDDDTRGLILSADIVVGFQTTALYEAVAAGRPTIHAAWGEAYERFRPGLIPFQDSSCVVHAGSPEELAAAVREPTPPPAGCDRWYEDVLGPVDGGAVDRTIDVLERVAEGGGRAGLSPGARRRALGMLPRAAVDELRLRAAAPIAAATGRYRGVSIRLAGAVDRRRRLVRRVAGRP